MSLQVGQLRMAIEVLLDEVERLHGDDLDLTAAAQARADREPGAGGDLVGDVAVITALPGAGSVDITKDLGHAIGVLRGLSDLGRAVPVTEA